MINLKSFIKGFILLLLFPITWILSFGFYLYFTPTLLGILFFFLYSTFFLLFIVLKVPFFKLFKLSKPKDINEWLIFWNVMFCFFPIACTGAIVVFINIANPFIFIPLYFLGFLYLVGFTPRWINDYKDVCALGCFYIFLSVPILWIFFGMLSGIGFYLTVLWFVNFLIIMIMTKYTDDKDKDSSDDWFYAVFMIGAICAFPPFFLLWLFKKD